MGNTGRKILTACRADSEHGKQLNGAASQPSEAMSKAKKRARIKRDKSLDKPNGLVSKRARLEGSLDAASDGCKSKLPTPLHLEPMATLVRFSRYCHVLTAGSLHDMHSISKSC